MLMQRLFAARALSSDERDEFRLLSTYYAELKVGLSRIDYAAMSPEVIERFKYYVLYAFNYDALVTNDLTVYSTYRLVVNESVTGRNSRITDAKYLKYPPLDVVKQMNRYNRANTPATNLFYSSESVDTTLKELRPPVNRILTLGIWEPNSGPPFVAYPVSHESAIEVNPGVKKAYDAFVSRKGLVDPEVYNYLGRYLDLIGSEYTKPVSNHLEYMVSAWLSERVFESREEPWRFDCILYPSVGNGLRTDNIAMLPAVMEARLKLTRVLQFEVAEAFYDRPYTEHHPEMITMAEVKNVVEARYVREDGSIDW